MPPDEKKENNKHFNVGKEQYAASGKDQSPGRRKSAADLLAGIREKVGAKAVMQGKAGGLKLREEQAKSEWLYF